MQAQAHPSQQSWIGIAITIAIVGLIMFRRIRSMGQLRPLKLETLWVVPALYLVLAAMMFWQLPPKAGWLSPRSSASPWARRSDGSVER